MKLGVGTAFIHFTLLEEPHKMFLHYSAHQNFKCLQVISNKLLVLIVKRYSYLHEYFTIFIFFYICIKIFQIPNNNHILPL